MLNIVDGNKYILEVESEACIHISIYNKNKIGLKKALSKAQLLMSGKEILSARILCSDSKEVVWALGK